MTFFGISPLLIEGTGRNNEAHPAPLKGAGIVTQVEHTGGGGLPHGEYVASIIAQVEHSELGPRYVSQLIVQVEYIETYPNVPKSVYKPRILVDIFEADGIKRMTTEDNYIEEI